MDLGLIIALDVCYTTPLYRLLFALPFHPKVKDTTLWHHLATSRGQPGHVHGQVHVIAYAKYIPAVCGLVSENNPLVKLTTKFALTNEFLVTLPIQINPPHPPTFHH